MTLVSAQALALVGAWTLPELATDPVEQGAVRRFAQAIMDDDPAYGPRAQTLYGGPIAPPLFPNHMLRRPFGTPDALDERARQDADFDGVLPAAGLPPLPGLQHLPVLNGGSEFEFYRYAQHGEWVTFRQRYADIREKATSKGPLVVVVIEAEVRTAEGELLLRSRRTLLRRSA